jgi:hypothetical protein
MNENATLDRLERDQMEHHIGDSFDMDVPIYQLKAQPVASFKANLSKHSDSFFACGNLVGQFYTLEKPVKLERVCFTGNFKGVLIGEKSKELYFEGLISDILIFRPHKDEK